MNSQDIEIAIKVLEQRQNTLDSRLKDVDECCGKLKGNISSEMRLTNERIVRVEHNIESNCKDVEIQLRGVQEQVKTHFNDIDEIRDDRDKIEESVSGLEKKLDARISKIVYYYMTFTIAVFSAIIIAVIALIH